MNLMSYTAPAQYVKHVVSELESRLNLNIESAYSRESSELTAPTVKYHTGEVDPIEGFANDGRKQHEIELRLLCYVPVSLPNFELEALDLSCRLMRELQDETFGDGELHDTLSVVSNAARGFNPESGFFLRVVTVKQMIRMGPLDETFGEIGGGIVDDIPAYPAD